MTTFSYHLKIELYSTPDPSDKTRLPANHQDLSSPFIWQPTEASSIFGPLPSHPRRDSERQARDFPPSILPPRREWDNDSDEGVGDCSSDTPTKNPSDPAAISSSVIDCGASRVPSRGDDGRQAVVLSERQWRARAQSIPPVQFSAGIGPRIARRDWRFGKLRIESLDMGVPQGQEDEASQHPGPAASLGPTFGGSGLATRARFESIKESKNTEIGWGIVHLYRETDDYSLDRPSQQPLPHRRRKSRDKPSSRDGSDHSGEEGDGTILCIPAVPGYMSPADFLSFVGEKWSNDVIHYRMIITNRMNRYMVLVKFRDAKRAQEWRQEFDGKVFNRIEHEVCHVAFIKSITIEKPNDEAQTRVAEHHLINSLKPLPPPTPSLVELPTCAVCLERMDDTAGLMTINCQHVFHCFCLQTWKGSGCPICRATNVRINNYHVKDDNHHAFGSGAANICKDCDCTSNLWICLICGNVGCGRYQNGHAKQHWKETAHSFSLELETQHVWDYAGDIWVHRLIREKGQQGKVVELPGKHGGDDDDVVPRAKLDTIGREYTHLLTSQLESQRVYFEEMISKAADKAAAAAAAADRATHQTQDALARLEVATAEQRHIRHELIPALEKDVARERARADRGTQLARQLGRSVQEEKAVSQGLMERIDHLTHELDQLRSQVQAAQAESAELREANHDLTMFISGQAKLRELEEQGEVEQGEVEKGRASVPEQKEPEVRRRGKKGRGKS